VTAGGQTNVAAGARRTIANAEGNAAGFGRLLSAVSCRRRDRTAFGVIAPELAALDVPVVSVISPLTPDVLTFAVVTVIIPDDEEEPYPLLSTRSYCR
jgi:hypothetical protein